MIGALMGNYEVGLYAAAVKLVEAWYFIPGIICTSLFPAIINAKKNNLEIYKHRLKNFYILMAVISILIAIPISLFAGQIIYILFGGGYIESVNILRIYIWSNLGLFLGTAAYQFLIAENRVMTIFIITTLAMIINIGLNLVFIPMFGLTGAAWATLISYMVVPLGSIYTNRVNNF
jgi:O-antigen/teichoic acid export membrane protein